jgi:hypothetical protein
VESSAFRRNAWPILLNRARQSHHENRGRFRLGADYDRIRNLFGCSVDALGILSPCARSRDNGCRPCAQTGIGAKVAREGLATSASKDRPGQALEGELALSCGVIALAALVCARAGGLP